MGNGCPHRFADVTDVRDVDAGWFSREQMARGDCIDCPSKNISVIRSVSKITGGESAWRPFVASDCTHPTWDLQADTIHEGREETLLGGIARLFTGPALDGIHYHRFLIANAKCRRCGAIWNMRSEYVEK